MTYNALDVLPKALDLLEQLKLEVADIRAGLAYNEATGGEYWDWEDTQRVEVEIAIIDRLIAALVNYCDGKGDNQHGDGSPRSHLES